MFAQMICERRTKILGYTGEVCYNEKIVYQEWKHNNKTFCLDYVQTYLRQKPCVLTQKAVDAAYADIYGGVSSCSSALYNVNEAVNIIKALTAANEIFDDNGNLTGAIKVQSRDENGDRAVINFYKADRISDVPEVTLDDRYRMERRCRISKDELSDINQKRLSSIDIIDVASVFRAIKCYQSYYGVVEAIINIKSKLDIYNLVENMQEILKSLNEIYIKKCAVTRTLENVLRRVSDAMALGASVYVSYVDGFLYTSIGENTIKTEVDNFFIVSELFQNIGITLCGAFMEITDKDTLMDFINSFSKNEKRNSEFEGIFKNISLVADNSEFYIAINAGY